MDQTSIIYYEDPNTGEYVEHLSLHGDENRILVDYEDIPEDMINATVAIEDRTFWEHHGVNWRRTLYGVILMFTGQDIQGGSTITQQFIKNFTGYDDVTVKRKIQEIFTALDFEKNYSKEQILEWYLNYIYLGDGCNGVATAAEHYFGKDLSELSLAECASIISITNNPTIYGPNSNVRMTNRGRRGDHRAGAQQTAPGAGALDDVGSGHHHRGGVPRPPWRRSWSSPPAWTRRSPTPSTTGTMSSSLPT